jgi:hypothetical protein
MKATADLAATKAFFRLRTGRPGDEHLEGDLSVCDVSTDARISSESSIRKFVECRIRHTGTIDSSATDLAFLDGQSLTFVWRLEYATDRNQIESALWQVLFPIVEKRLPHAELLVNT